MIQHRRLLLPLLLVVATGCTQSTAHRLVGTWEGKPTPAEEGHPSQLSAVDVRVTLQLDQGGAATMWRGDGEDRLAGRLSGRWSILKSSGTSARLQLAVDREEGEETEVRNFQIEFAEDTGQFKLTEEGADPMFGSLSFERKS